MSGSEQARTPGLIVLVNGQPAAGAISAHVTSTACYGADCFRVDIALSADPLMSAPFWADTANIAIDIRFVLGGVAASVLTGVVDQVVLDPVCGVAILTGRDRSAELIEARTQETFANQTSSDVAMILAGRRGLTPDVMATTTPVGRYWQLEHDHITLDQFSRTCTEWDLLVVLAGREGFDVWVSQNTLNFRPAATAPQAMLRAVATSNGSANVTSLRLERSLVLASDIEVLVKSWSSRAGRGITQSARASRGGGAAARSYHFVVPDLTPDAALQMAQSRLAELSRYERTIIAEMPGDLVIGAHGMVRVEGTGTAFDQDYWVDEVERVLSVRHGFQQIVRARNVSPGAEIG